MSDTSFNGYFTVASISSTTVFTFAQTAANATSSGGFTTEIVYSLLSSGTALSSFAGPVVLNANSAIDGLEITQAGAGDALNITGTTTMTGNSTVSGTLGVTGVLTANAGVVVDNITIDGNEIDVSSGDLTLDVAGDIILDFDGGDLRLKDGGTEIGLITSDGSNKDIIFYGNDNGSTIAALTLDMSTGGTAYFSDDVRLTDNHALRLGTDSDIVFYHDNSNGYLVNEAGNLTLDVAGDIILDADGAEIIFKDGGTQFGEIYKNGNDLRLESNISNGYP